VCVCVCVRARARVYVCVRARACARATVVSNRKSNDLNQIHVSASHLSDSKSTENELEDAVPVGAARLAQFCVDHQQLVLVRHESAAM
jgi:hypothetical protein